MGSKHALSNGNESEEVTELLVAFEEQNQCKITLSASLALHNGSLDICWTATVIGGSTGLLVASPLASLNVTVWGGEFKTLMAVHTRLLYALDFLLAEEEFKKVELKRA